MAKLEAAPEAREGDSNLDKLSRQLADKEKAKKQRRPADDRESRLEALLRSERR